MGLPPVCAGCLQLLHQALTIWHPPLLNNSSSNHPVNGNLPDSYLPSGRSDARELASLGSSRCKPYDDPVAFRYNVVDPLVPVRKRSSMARDRTLDALHASPLHSTNKVTDKVGRVQLICHSKVERRCCRCRWRLPSSPAPGARRSDCRVR
jgi:hypothetical protein